MSSFKLFVLLFPSIFLAQEPLAQLTTPTSPAAALLDLNPTVTLAPKSYQALETALYSNFVNSNNETVIPTDFALEFTPYWTKNHGLSITEYLYPENLGTQLLRSSSVSIASTQNFVLGDSTSTNALGIGYRASFFFPNKKDKAIVEKSIGEIRNDFNLKNEIRAPAILFLEINPEASKADFLKEIMPTVISEINKSKHFSDPEELQKFLNKFEAELLALPEITPATKDAFLDQFSQILDQEYQTYRLISNFEEYLTRRQGLTLDIGLATLLNFPDNTFEFSYVPKSSLWITPSYRFTNNFDFLKALGVFRYEWYHDTYYDRYFPDTFVFKNNLDYGISIISEFKRFSLQFELIGRHSSSEISVATDDFGNDLFRKETKSDLQYTGNFSYNVTDGIVLTYTLGSRFRTIFEPKNTLISLLALNFGFGAPTTNDIALNKK